MPSILESLVGLLGQGNTMAEIGTLLGGDVDEAATAVDAAGPALIGGLSEVASADGGADTIGGMLDAADTSILDDVSGFFDADSDDSDSDSDSDAGGEAGSGLVDAIFGDDRAELIDGLASESGLDGTVFSKLLPKLAPLMVSSLSKLRDDDDLDPDEVVGLLASERQELEADGKLGDWFSSLAKGGALTGAAAQAKDKASDDAEDAASDDAESADDADAGAAKTSALEKGDDLKPAAGDQVDRDRRGGLGWLWWVVGAVLLVLFLAWLLNQCGGDDENATSGPSDGATTTAAADDSAGDDSADDDSAGDDGADDDGADDDSAGDAAADDGAGDDSAAADDGDLQGLVDAALAGADLGASSDGVSGVVDGDSVTLTGTLDSEDAKAAAEAAVNGVDGISAVVNDIVVEAPDAGGENSGGSLNDELGLAPIRFDYRSAEISTEGQAVLAEVISYLEANEGNVEIEGHTDSDGGEAENLALSQRRAESVKAYLEANGVAAERMTTVGLGESDPEVPNDSADNKAINRRIEFVLQS